MLIVIDFDETYTMDMPLWDDFIKASQKKGHSVICATMRYDNDAEAPCVRESIGKLCKVVFTGRQAKKRFIEELGYRVNIWIDDTPEWLFQNG